MFFLRAFSPKFLHPDFKINEVDFKITSLKLNCEFKCSEKQLKHITVFHNACIQSIVNA